MLVQERKTEDVASPPSEKEITVGRKKSLFLQSGVNEPESSSETSVLPSPSQEEGNMKRSLEHHGPHVSAPCIQMQHSLAALTAAPASPSEASHPAGGTQGCEFW